MKEVQKIASRLEKILMETGQFTPQKNCKEEDPLLKEFLHYELENERLPMVNEKVQKISSSLEKKLMETNQFTRKQMCKEIEHTLLKELLLYDFENKRLLMENEMYEEKQAYLLSQIDSIAANAISSNAEVKQRMLELELRNAKLERQFQQVAEGLMEKQRERDHLDELTQEVKMLKSILQNTFCIGEQLKTQNEQLQWEVDWLRIEKQNLFGTEWLSQDQKRQKTNEEQLKEIEELEIENKQLQREVEWLRMGNHNCFHADWLSQVQKQQKINEEKLREIEELQIDNELLQWEVQCLRMGNQNCFDAGWLSQIQKQQKINEEQLKQIKQLSIENEQLHWEVEWLRRENQNYFDTDWLPQVHKQQKINQEQLKEIVQLKAELEKMHAIIWSLSMVDSSGGECQGRKVEDSHMFPHQTLLAMEAAAGMVRAVEGNDGTRKKDWEVGVNREEEAERFHDCLAESWERFGETWKESEEMNMKRGIWF